MSGSSRYEIDIIANNKAASALGKTDKQLKKIQGSSKKVNSNFRAMKIAAGAAAAAFAGFKLAQSLIKTAVQFENLAIQLNTLTGSATEGARALGIVEKAAADSAFAFEDMANSSALLLTVGDVDQLAGSLEMVGDIAAVSGLEFDVVAGQIQRAFSGGIASADIFREKGIKSMLGFQEGVTYSAQETEDKIRKMFENGTAYASGGAAAFALTWTGQLSLIGDKITAFKKAIMDAGLFQALKDQLIKVNEFLKTNEEAVKRIAVAIGEGLAEAVVTLGEGVAFIAEHADLFLIAAKGLVLVMLAKWVYGAATALLAMRTALMGVMAFMGPVGIASLLAGTAALVIAMKSIGSDAEDAADDMTNAFQRKEIEKAIAEKTKQLDLLKNSIEEVDKVISSPEIMSLKDRYAVFGDENGNISGENFQAAVDKDFDKMKSILISEIEELNAELKTIPLFDGLGPILIKGGPENEMAIDEIVDGFKKLGVVTDTYTGHLSHNVDTTKTAVEIMQDSFIPAITTSTDMLSHMARTAYDTISPIEIMQQAFHSGSTDMLSHNAPAVQVYTEKVMHATEIMGLATEAALALKNELAEQASELQTLQDRYDPLSASMRRINEDLAEAKELYDEGAMSGAEYAKVVRDISVAQGKLQDRMKGTNKTFKETTKDMRTDSEKFIDGFNEDFNKKFADGLVNGTLGFQTFAGSLKSMLSDLLTDFLNGGTMFKDIMSMFGGLFGGGGGGFNIGDIVGGGGMKAGPFDYLQQAPMIAGPIAALLPQFAAGGRLGAGKMGIAGEAGPEIITGPANIMSNEDSFGNSGDKPQVNITIQAIDTQTGTEFLLKNRKQVEGIIQSAYNKRGKQGIY